MSVQLRHSVRALTSDCLDQTRDPSASHTVPAVGRGAAKSVWSVRDDVLCDVVPCASDHRRRVARCMERVFQ